MKKKKGFTGLPDLIIAGGIMIASFFFPYLGYRYQKVNYTKTGLDLMKGFSSEDGKVAMAASVPMIIAIILSVVILLVGLLSIKEAKSLFAGIGTLASLVVIVLNLYLASGIADTLRKAKKVRITYGSVILVVLGFYVLIRTLMALYRNKTISILDFMAVPGMLYFVINNYIPMVGIAIAFKKVDYAKGILASPWVGFDNFKMLFQSNGNFFTSNAWIITRNTLLYNLVFIILGVFTGVVVGICLAGVTRKFLQKFFQTSILLPQLISYVIIAYIVYAFLSNETGLVNHILGEANAINFYAEKKYWPFILVFIYIWKQIGYNGIIFLSSIVGIDKSVLEACKVDGCTKWQQLRYVTLPLLKPTIITLTMLQVGRIFYSDFGLFYQVPLNSGALYDVTNTVDTYVYRMLMTMNNISVSSAASTYQAVVGFILVFVVNMIVRKHDKENALF